MSNVLKNKVKQETKLGCQLTKYNGRNSFFLKHRPENEARRLVPHLFLFSKNFLYEVKTSGQT